MNKSAEKLIKPNVIIEDQNLNAAGFIQSGKLRFKEVVFAFSDDLFLKSVKYSDAGARIKLHYSFSIIPYFFSILKRVFMNLSSSPLRISSKV